MKAEPFSFSVAAAEIPAEGRHFRIKANAEERSRLAAALDIPAVEELTAELSLRPTFGGAFSVRGSLSATVVQTDIVTLDTVTQGVAEAIDLTLLPAEDVAGRRIEPKVTGEADALDCFHNGRIDLGAIVGEHLALGLDPYPRAPGVAFEGHIEDDPARDPSPFAGLAVLKARGD